MTASKDDIICTVISIEYEEFVFEAPSSCSPGSLRHSAQTRITLAGEVFKDKLLALKIFRL